MNLHMNIIRKICNWYFSRKALPYWCILAMDCIIVFVSGLLVYYLQHGGLGLAQHFWQVALGLAVCLVVYIISFFSFHTYHGVMRYSGFHDMSRGDSSIRKVFVYGCMQGGIALAKS